MSLIVKLAPTSVRSVGVERTGLFSRLAVAALLVGVVAAFSLWPFWTLNPVTGVINLLVAVSFVITGAALAGTSGHRLTAALLVATAFFWLLSWWWAWPDAWQVGPLAMLSNVCGYLWFVCGGIALLRYPDGRSTGYEKAYFVTLGGWVVGGKLLIAAVGRPEWGGYSSWSWWPVIAPNRRLFDLGNAIFYAGVVALAVLMLVLLVVRIHRSRGVDRLDALPVTVAACTVTISGAIYLSARLFAFPPQAIGALQTCMGVAALVTPLAFLLAVMRRRLAHLAVADLVVRIAGATTPERVEAELRDVLGHDLELWVREPARGVYRSTDGRECARPSRGGRWEQRIEGSTGAHLAVVHLDPALGRVPAFVHSAVVAAGLALDVQAQIGEVRASRERIVAAADSERRRIERDLHDGVQQALLAVSAQLSAARLKTEDGSSAAGTIDSARSALSDALVEMRRMARGIHPALLTESGLAVAIRDVAERLPLDVTVDVPVERLRADVELTAYFIVCEALANVVHHAATTTAAVGIARRTDALEIRVSDDGQGGATLTTGSGLGGLRDRVHALGGGFEIHSVAGGGTRIQAVIPCA